LRRILRWVVGIPVILIVMGFAVANRNWTRLSLDPFNQADPQVYINLPLWWMAQGKWRRLARERQREIARLQGEMAIARDGPEKVEAQMLAPLPGIMP
jgi:hypothetical protein